MSAKTTGMSIEYQRYIAGILEREERVVKYPQPSKYIPNW